MACYPMAFEEKMRALLGDEAAAFFHALQQQSVHGLRINPAKIAADAFEKRACFALSPVPWCAEGFYLEDALQRPGKHPYHEAGVYYLQDPSAMSAVELLAPQPGETVLDLCAAPGGKSTQIAAKIGPEGLLIANEIHPARAKQLSQNIERLGFGNTVVTCEAPEKLAGRFVGFFDRVLVDAPCSGEGMFRKNEQAEKHWSRENVLFCAERQQDVLHRAAEMLKPGGFLLYATCTFAPEEDEGTLVRFLQTHPSFALVQREQPYFSPGRPDWIETDLPSVSRAFRLWPHKLRGEGHFIALMQKQDGPRGCAVPAAVLMGENKAPKAYLKFADQALAKPVCGPYLLFGEQLYAPPHGLPKLDGLKVLRPGLHLGTLQKDRFIPSHALSHALRPEDVRLICRFPANAPETAAYLQGQALGFDGGTGWGLFCADEFPLGWGKASGGQWKNHYPKGLRWM